MASAVRGIERMHADILAAEPTTDEEKKKVVAELKSRGNAAFKQKRCEEAHFLYSAALDIDDTTFDTSYAIFGNRSAVNEMMGKGKQALEDANSALVVHPTWAKGFFRKGKALACLKRYRASTEAFEAALELEPKSKMLKKSLDKAKQTEIKAKEAAIKKASEKAVAPEVIKMAAPTMTKGTSNKSSSSNTKSDVIKSKGGDGLMKGYKKNKDGKTTSFFNIDIDEEAKKLIGSIAPKKMLNAPVEDKELMGLGASAWNKGGTYEERDCSEWAENWLRATFSDVTSMEAENGMKFTCTDVSSLEGMCNAVLRQGKKRYVFDYELTVDFEVVVDGTVVQGEVSTTDFSSEAEGECEITCVYKKDGKSVLQNSGNKKVLREWIATFVNNIWSNFVTTYRSTH